jgi:hypothetical protein
MKTLLISLLLASAVIAQTVSPAAKDGSNITSSSTWRNFILPTPSASGQVPTWDGDSWEAATGGGTVDNAAVNAAIATNTAASRLALELNGVVVSKADGTRKGYAPSANTDTARGLALEAAFAAAVAGDTIDLSPGNYYVAKATTNVGGLPVQYVILDKMTVRFNGARLYHTATENTYYMFSAAISSIISDWSFIGPGIIEGSASASSGAAECGINILGGSGAAAYRFRMENMTFRFWRNAGVLLNTGSYGTYKTPSGSFVGCHFNYNNQGFYALSGAEFMQLVNCTFNNNLTGIYLDAGNCHFSNCIAAYNTNYGLRILASGNHAHGTWNGGAISHNSNFAVHVATGVTNGFTFTGGHFAGSAGTDNKMQLDGYGLHFNGGYWDSPIYTTAVNSGINSMQGVHISNTTTATLTNMFAGSRSKLKIRDCHSNTGPWSANDIRSTYSTDADAGGGGVLQGELWQQTTTGAVFVKL